MVTTSSPKSDGLLGSSSSFMVQAEANTIAASTAIYVANLFMIDSPFVYSNSWYTSSAKSSHSAEVTMLMDTAEEVNVSCM